MPFVNALMNLFGKSPFTSLAAHMEQVSTCVYLLNDLFDALQKKEHNTLKEIAEKISEEEHKADLIKNDIRNHLPKSLYLPIDKSRLLEILSLQDCIADRAEDIAVLTTLKKIEMPLSLEPEFYEFLEKNKEAFEGARLIIKELHELLESSFAPSETEKVRKMVHNVAKMEHEADLIQRKILKKLLNAEQEMSYTTFYLWQKILESLGSISNLSENLANRVRALLELK